MRKGKSYSTTKIIARFLVFAKPYRIFVIGFLIVSLVNVFTSLSEGYLVKNIVDAALKRDKTRILFYIYVMLPIIALGLIVTYLLKYLYGYFSSNAMKDFRLSLYGHFQKFPVAYFEKRHTGDLLSRFTNDATSVQEFFGQEFLNLFLDVVLFMSAFIYMATINWKLLLFSIMLSPPALLGVNFMADRIKKYSRMNHEFSGKANAVVQDAIGGIAMVKAYNLQENLLKRFEAEAKNSLKYSLKELNMIVFSTPLHVILRTIPTVMCVSYGAYLSVNHQLTPGDLMAFIYLLGYVSWPLAFLTDRINKIKEAAGASERVLEILDNTCERTDGEDIHNVVFSPAIKFERVYFSYDQDVKILDGLCLSIERGKKIAIVGASGCGKSTMLKLLCGFLAPTRGEINVFGKNLKDIRIGSLRSMIALVTQDTYLFPVSVAENISYGCLDTTMDEIVEASKAANAYDFIMSLPEGFNTNIGERGGQLSGGQKQRIAVARAILKKVPILLLDEPTSSLDSESEVLVQEALEKVMEGRTTIIVTHRYSTIKSADEILVLDKGCIAQKGKHDELIALNGIYRQLYEKQFSPDGTNGGEAIA